MTHTHTHTSLATQTQQSDWNSSQWLYLPDNIPDNQLRANIAVPAGRGEVERATCFVSGLGYQRTWLNGDRLATDPEREAAVGETTLGYFMQFQRRLG